MTASYTIGVDVGGTFTDCAVVGTDGTLATGKVPTRPDERSRSFLEAIEEAGRRLGLDASELLSRCDRLVHGTTTGTNALITRAGATVGLLTTAGHGDAISIMRGVGRMTGLSPDLLWDMASTDKPEPLVPVRRIGEVVERTDVDGIVLVPLDEDSVIAEADRIVAAGADSIAISLLWSIRNPTHERRVAEIVRERYPDLFVTCASDVSSYLGEYERTMAGVVNAYLGPLMIRYLDAIEDGVRQRRFSGRILYAQCAGGALTGEEARRIPARTVNSGPVSGVLASSFAADLIGEPDVIVADMGGTSFDVSVVSELVPNIREVSVLERFEVALPALYIDTIGAGGGSIAWIDEAGGLQVGPDSAGAYPGPACYGNGGTRATVTDADLVLGILNPDNFLHGKQKLDLAAAHDTIGTLATQLGLSVHETAAGIQRIVDAKMADLLRRMSVFRGFDPRAFTVFAYGGAGGAHVGAVAREVGSAKIVVPVLPLASVWSAFGAIVAKVVHVHDSWLDLPVPADPDKVGELLASLEDKATSQLADEGFGAERRRLERTMRMRYAAQLHHLEVPLPAGPVTAELLADAVERFAGTYDRLHGAGAGYREGGTTITGIRVRASGMTDQPVLSEAELLTDVTESERPVYWSEYGALRPTRVVTLDRGGRLTGELVGPVLIELPDTVVAIRPGQRASFDTLGNLTIDTTRSAPTSDA
jgi:N-methylhydantoinase A